MELKNPVTQQGFEIICKHNAELKEENNKLLDVINNQDVKIADLEKEKEELRAKYLQATDEGTSFAHLKSLEWKNIKLEEQNTKWKEDYIALENLKDNQIADLEKQLKESEHNKKTVVHLADCLEEKMKDKIADLEKKVKYYEQQLSAMEKGVCDVCKVTDADYYKNQIADLEKKLKESEHNKKTVVHLSECVSDIQDKQLEQAEGIIKLLLWNLRNKYYDPAKDIVKAEQFLERNDIKNIPALLDKDNLKREEKL